MNTSKTIITILVVILSLSKTCLAQNNSSTKESTKVYLIQAWNHNDDLKNGSKKMINALEEIKNGILMSKDFSYFLEFKTDKFILVSSVNQAVHIKTIQNHFQPYRIKVNIAEIKEVSSTSLNITTLPVYTNQNVNSFNKQLEVWSNNNKTILAHLKTLFQ